MASFNDGDGVWRTISGRHIFIRNGQSISSAMKQSGKFKLSKKQIEAGKKLSEAGEKGVRDDIKTYLKGEGEYEGSKEDFIKDVSNEWGVEKGKVEKIYNEEAGKQEKSTRNKTKMQEMAVKGAPEKDLKEQYKQSLNEVSKMEHDGKINKEEYEKSVKNINDNYINKRNEYKRINIKASVNNASGKGTFENFEIGNDIRGIYNKETGEVRYTTGTNSTNRNEYKTNIKDMEGGPFKTNHEGRVKNYLDSKTGENEKSASKNATYSWSKDEEGTTYGYKNQYGTTLNQLQIDDEAKEYRVGSFKMKNDKTTTRKDFNSKVEELENAGYKKVDYWSERKGTGSNTSNIKSENNSSNSDAKNIKQLNNEMLKDRYRGKGETPSLIYSHDRRIDIVNNDEGGKTATIWKDGKIERKTRLPENVKGDKTKQYFDDYLGKLDETIRKSENGNDWLRNAYNEYKKQHPNTKMSFNTFKKNNQ